MLRFNLGLFGKTKWTKGYFRIRVANKDVYELYPNQWDFENNFKTFDEIKWFNDTQIKILDKQAVEIQLESYEIKFEQFSLEENISSYFVINAP